MNKVNLLDKFKVSIPKGRFILPTLNRNLFSCRDSCFNNNILKVVINEIFSDSDFG